MNIFALDGNPTQAAKYHVDKHVIKMILEYCQLMSTAHRVIDGQPRQELSKNGRKIKRYYLGDERDDIVYLACHINHPSGVWTRADRSHYVWLARLLKATCAEYTYRYGKVHKSQRDGLVDWLCDNVPENIPDTGIFRFPDPAMPDTSKVYECGQINVVESYRKYYRDEKQRMHSWSGKINGRTQPEWI